MLPRAAEPDGTPPEGAGSTAPRGLQPTLLVVATVVTVIGSLGAPLVPTVAVEHDVPLATAQWSLTLPVLVGAVATPVLGRLGDGPHRRAVVLTVLGVVATGSLLAALPHGLGWLLAGRALQGLGLGLTPLAIATARDALRGERAQRAAAALSITTVVGVGLGYPLAGWITEQAGLSAAFGAGAALSGGAWVAAARVLPRSSASAARPLDVPGALLLGAGLAAGLLLLGDGGRLGWSSAPAAALAAVGFLGLAAFTVRELRTPAPLVDLRQLRRAGLVLAHSAALLAGVANYLLLTVVTVIAQAPPATGYGFGVGVAVSGLLLLPFSVGSLLAGQLAGRIPTDSGAGWVLVAGAGLTATAFAVLAGGPDRLAVLFALMGLGGLGIGGTFAAMPRLVFAAVPRGGTGSAMGVNQVARYVGFAIGGALAASVLHAATTAGAVLPGGSGVTAVAVTGGAVSLGSAALATALGLGPVRRGRGAA